jgi:hypothetical protein
MKATKGTIAGWNINTNYLSGGSGSQDLPVHLPESGGGVLLGRI